MPESRTKLTLLTITSDRQLAFSLLERYVSKQDYSGDVQWIVVDDGVEPVTCTLGQDYYRREPCIGQSKSYRGNFIDALSHVAGEKVIVLEDDEWYAPSYLSIMARHLDDVELAGFGRTHSYNVRYRRYGQWNNMHFAFMSQTGFRKTVVPELARIIQENDTLYPDVLLWKQPSSKRVWDLDQVEERITLGIKGMPGKAGISDPHRPSWFSFRHDLDGSKLREFLGDDAEIYLPFYDPQRPFYEPWLNARL